VSLVRQQSAWLVLAVLLFIVAVLTVAAASGGSSAPLSLDSATPDGGLALKLWLSRIGYTVERNESYAAPSRTATALLLQPQRDPSAAEVSALKRWTRQGGRLVIATDMAWGLLSAFGVLPTFASPAALNVTEPLLLDPPAVRLSGSAEVVAGESSSGVAVAATQFGTVLVRRSLGQGEVWALTAPTLLDNSHIGRAQNRRLALNLAGRPGPIVVDQPSPIAGGQPGSGSSSGPTQGWLTGTAWGIAILFGLAVVMLFRWLGGWRLGPALVPFSEHRRPAVEYVLSLATLLRRAQRRADVLAVYQRELQEALRRRFGTDASEELPRDVRERVEPLLRPAADMSEEALISWAEAIVREEEALRERV
jgi:hypothetical protein